MSISAERIKPAQSGKSDFFSWKLYQFIKKHGSDVRVFDGTWNPITGHDKENTSLFIGRISDDGWFSGRRMNDLTRPGSGTDNFSYPGGSFRLDEWKDITDQFWKDYLRIGVCALRQYRHEWELLGERRVCNYCGAAEYRHVVMKPHEHWESLPQREVA